MIEKLLTPVSDSLLRKIVHFTMGSSFLVALVESNVIQIGQLPLLRLALVTAVGVLVCISLCKTLAHKVMPEIYIRYGSYIMALGYSLYVGNEMLARVSSHLA